MYQYVIVVKKEQLLIDDDFKKYFHNSIRSVALSCDISNDIPFTYSRIIPNIKDNEIGKSLFRKEVLLSQRQKSLIPLQKKPYALCVVLKPKNLLIHKLLMA